MIFVWLLFLWLSHLLGKQHFLFHFLFSSLSGKFCCLQITYAKILDGDQAEIKWESCANPESFVKGVQLWQGFFLVDEGREDQNNTKSGGHHGPASEMPFQWRPNI